MSLSLRLVVPVLLVLSGPSLRPALADEQQTMRFTASLLGVTVGRMSLSVSQSDTAYAVASQTASSGLAGLFSPFKVTSRVKGSVKGNSLRPIRYESTGEGERAGRGAVLEYEAGVPRVVSMEAERKPGAPVLDPATQAGKVDPLTLTYALLRDIPVTEACSLQLEIFDGHRAARANLGNPQVTDDGVICSGLYRRVDGYPPEDMAERQDFPFTVTYVTLPDGRLRPVEIVLDSLFGVARLTRDE